MPSPVRGLRRGTTCPYCGERRTMDDGPCCVVCDRCHEFLKSDESGYLVLSAQGTRVLICGEDCFRTGDRFINEHERGQP
jgi:hypothetical protein